MNESAKNIMDFWFVLSFLDCEFKKEENFFLKPHSSW